MRFCRSGIRSQTITYMGHFCRALNDIREHTKPIIDDYPKVSLSAARHRIIIP